MMDVLTSHSSMMEELAWLSPRWERQEELKKAWRVIKFVNQAGVTVVDGRAGAKLGPHVVYIPDTAVCSIRDGGGADTGLSHLWDPSPMTAGVRIYDLSEFDEPTVLIMLVVLTAGLPDALAFVMPEHSAGVVRFVQMFLPALESTTNLLVSYVVDGVVERRSQAAAAALVALAVECRDVDRRFGGDVSVREALGYAVWLHPPVVHRAAAADEIFAAVDRLIAEHRQVRIVCHHKKIQMNWSDVLCTWMMIQYGDVVQLERLAQMRDS